MEALIYVHGLSGGHDGGVDESIVDSKLTSICEVWSFADRASEVEAPWLWVSIACGDWPASRAAAAASVNSTVGPCCVAVRRGGALGCCMWGPIFHLRHQLPSSIYLYGI